MLHVNNRWTFNTYIYTLYIVLHMYVSSIWNPDCTHHIIFNTIPFREHMRMVNGTVCLWLVIKLICLFTCYIWCITLSPALCHFHYHSINTTKLTRVINYFFWLYTYAYSVCVCVLCIYVDDGDGKSREEQSEKKTEQHRSSMCNNKKLFKRARCGSQHVTPTYHFYIRSNLQHIFIITISLRACVQNQLSDV